jgi:hypothetical protein
VLCGGEYDKLYINDPDMKLAAKQLKSTKLLFRCIVAAAGKWRKQVVDVVVIKIIK